MDNVLLTFIFLNFNTVIILLSKQKKIWYHFLLLWVQVFNNSPDETAYFRMILNRENVANSVVMIQPSLISYSFQNPPEPALLDVAAISVERILLLDSFFTIVVFHGSTIAQWRKAGYHNQPEHEVILNEKLHFQTDGVSIMLFFKHMRSVTVCNPFLMAGSN